MDLARTAKALEAYDEFQTTFDEMSTSNKDLSDWFKKDNLLATQVGIAYGLDTSDINDPKTCEQVVRPGRIPTKSWETVSFVRRMVHKWKNEKETDQ